jgi:hypothetical protein
MKPETDGRQFRVSSFEFRVNGPPACGQTLDPKPESVRQKPGNGQRQFRVLSFEFRVDGPPACGHGWIGRSQAVDPKPETRNHKPSALNKKKAFAMPLALGCVLAVGSLWAATPGPSGGSYAVTTDVVAGGGGGGSGGAYEHQGCAAQTAVGVSTGAVNEAQHGYLAQINELYITLTGITPVGGRMGGHKPPGYLAAATITGSNFEPGATVSFISAWSSALAGSPLTVDASTITCETPPQVAGPADVNVTNPGGASAKLDDAYAYAGWEGDIALRANLGDEDLAASDLTQMRRFVAGLDTPAAGPEFQRADVAPRTDSGDGEMQATDLSQQRRYVAGLEPFTAAGGAFSGPGP